MISVLCYNNSGVVQKSNNVCADSDTSMNDRQENDGGNDEGNEYYVVRMKKLQFKSVIISLSG